MIPLHVAMERKQRNQTKLPGPSKRPTHQWQKKCMEFLYCMAWLYRLLSICLLKAEPTPRQKHSRHLRTSFSITKLFQANVNTKVWPDFGLAFKSSLFNRDTRNHETIDNKSETIDKNFTIWYPILKFGEKILNSVLDQNT